MSDSRNPTALIASGNTYLHEGRHDLAFAAFERALAIEPDARAFYGRALVHQHRNALDQAIADFGRVLDLDPTHIDALFKRSAVHRLKGAFDEAAADFDRAIQSLWRHRERPGSSAPADPQAAGTGAPKLGAAA